MRLRCALLGLLVVPALALGQGEGIGDPTFPTLGNTGYRASHYDLKIDYNPATNVLRGDATMEAMATANLPRFSLDFSGFAIAKVLLDGTAVTYERTASKLRIRPAQPISVGTRFRLETVYSGTPRQAQSGALPAGFTSGWISYQGGAVTVCEPELAHTWFPCNDHPRNKATFDIEILAPRGYTAIANGAQSATPAGTVRFVLDKPALTCMALVAIGNYRVFRQVGPHNLPITNYLPKGSVVQFEPALAVTPKFIKYLEDRIGPYPFDSYGTVILPDAATQANQLMAGAAIETTTIPVFGQGPATDPETLCHELTHQWMGDCVSVTNWGDDIWWVEGFAQYAQWLYEEQAKGKAAYDALVSSTAAQFSGSGQWLKPGHLTAAEMFGPQSYVGGALTFSALRNNLGDEKFFLTVRGFIDKNRYGDASVKDWIEVASKIAGHDMKPFFDAWLYGSTEPKMP